MKINTGIVLGGILSAAIASAAQADFTLANWTFETSQPVTAGPHTAELGLNASGSFASGSHAGAATYSTPAGNGSLHAFSSNTWAVNDYYQFTTSTTTYSGIKISWDQTGSATGPRDFTLQYSTNGTTFTNFTTYQITSPAVSWSTVTPVATTSYAFDLSAVTALDNVSTIYIRFAMNSTTAVNGTTVAAAGTGRVDNIVISATTPAPGALALLGLAGVVGSRRRRRA